MSSINLLVRTPEEIKSILPKLLYEKKEDCQNHEIVYYNYLFSPTGDVLDYNKTEDLCSKVTTCLFDRIDKIGGIKVLSCDGKEIKMKCPEHKHYGTVLLILKNAELDSTLDFTHYFYDLGIICQNTFFHKLDEVVLKDISNVKSILEKLSYEKKEGCFFPKTVYYPKEKLSKYKTAKELLNGLDISPFNLEDKVAAMKITSCDGKEIMIKCPEHKHLAMVLLVLKNVKQWVYSTHDMPYVTQIFDKGYFCEEEGIFHKLPGEEKIGPTWAEE